MNRDRFKSAEILSAVIAALMLGAALAGLLVPGLYRENLFVLSAWRGNDLVTLFIGAPLLAASLFFARRGSTRARLVWLGMLDYSLYTYAYYLFGASFNSLFLAYVAIFTLSMLALIFALANLDTQSIAARFRERTPVRWIAGYMLFVAAGLTTVYVAQSLAFVFNGELPVIVTRSGHPTSVVFALDLSLLVPFFLLGALWLWRRRPWGYVVSTILAVKGSVYPLALAAGSLLGAQAGVEGALDELPLWLFLSLGGVVTSLLLLGNLREGQD